MARGKAYRRWKTISKYITRLKNVAHKWVILDPSPNRKSKYRDAKSWKDLDSNSHHAKILKNTTVRSSSEFNKIDRHHAVKNARRDAKKIIGEELSTDDI